ncbi:heterokaryon incompatibility protein-domain-containing protein [Stachybotrys elegans]|uniref:Heterokaryon incompatibility protein-domain-containing protein n=1 Tax=Stachybotrys elegans TaxID=80388 RepID=A0A8K0SJS2_9HYPO|nr:heterokaryon incompatibility protein-domain-containing protein [Stachybotrys elegans]
MRYPRLRISRRIPSAQTRYGRAMQPARHHAGQDESGQAPGSGDTLNGEQNGRDVALTFAVVLAALYGTWTLSSSFIRQLATWNEQFRTSRVAISRPTPDYAPLEDTDNHIRLLVLERGDDSAQVRCRLQHVSLVTSPRFEALSYVWGASSNNNAPQILCDDKEVPVGQNLYSALRNLRRPDGERILWVDALCINQGDPLEKAKQIPLMSRIYEQAASVIIWLGEPTKHSSEAMTTLRKLNEHFAASLPFYGKSLLSVATRSMIYRNLPFIKGRQWDKEKATLTSFNWSAVGAVMNNPWFLRVWVFQELAKATAAIVVFGHDQMPLDDFLRPIAEIWLHPLGKEIIGPHLSAEASRSMRTLIRIVTETGPEARKEMTSRWPLHHLVAKESFRDVTDDRDRIFAFRDVANDIDETDWEVLPDYTASVEQVYLRFARWCLLQRNSPELLLYAGKPSPGSPGALLADSGAAVLPSWVPDWRHNSLETMNPMPGDYNASGTSKLHVSWKPDQPTLLRVKGRIVDRVDEVSVSRLHLTALDHFEFATKKKFDFEAVKEKLKKDQRFWFLRRGQALPSGFLSKYVIAWDQQGLKKTFDIHLLREAQEARRRFGTEKLPAHEMTNIVWMENCKHIAASHTGGTLTPDRLDALWRTMSYSSPSLPKRDFAAYLAFLKDVGQGKRTTKSLQGTAFQLPRNRASAARTPLPTTQWHRPLHSPSGIARKPNSSVETEELRLRYTMHSHFGSVFSRRFCSTAQNRLGWVPLGAQTGDVICILDGVKIPVVLRSLSKSVYESEEKVKGTGIKYELIGPCYINSIMQSELNNSKLYNKEFLELF